LERFLEAGYERNTAIKAINSVLVFKSDSESYSTVDVCLVDLYSGFGEFIKIGSAPTFIKTGSGVNLIRSTNLPVGILDDVDIESEIVELKNGDMIVMVSDGVSDASSQLKEKWIINMLREIENVNPKEVAEALLKRAKELSGEKLNDDMTVMVSKIWKLM
jgi:stage II sporulation protein E